MFLLVFIVSSLVTCIVELLHIFICSCSRDQHFLNANKSSGEFRASTCNVNTQEKFNLKANFK
jgi:hypothetical protein